MRRVCWSRGRSKRGRATRVPRLHSLRPRRGEATGAQPARARHGRAPRRDLRGFIRVPGPPCRAHGLRLGAHRGHLDHGVPGLLEGAGRAGLDPREHGGPDHRLGGGVDPGPGGPPPAPPRPARVSDGLGAQAGFVFKGLFVGLVFKLVTAVVKLWNAVPELHVPSLKASKVACDISPELMGVGYIIGYRSSAIMVGGGLLSWLVIIPAIALFGEGRATPLFPATTLIGDMSPDEIWSRYIRYIGAGAVAAGGIIN